MGIALEVVVVRKNRRKSPPEGSPYAGNGDVPLVASVFRDRQGEHSRSYVVVWLVTVDMDACSDEGGVGGKPKFGICRLDP